MIKKLKNTIQEQLYQGATAKGLSLSVTIAVMFGAFPLIGVTTIFCLLVGALLKLNHPTIQITNYLMAPVQLIMMPVFLRVGEHLVGAKPVPFNPVTMISDFFSHPAVFISHYGMAGAMAALAWVVLIPWIGGLVYYVTYFLLNRTQRCR